MILATHSSTDNLSVRRWISGVSGASYGAEIPVKFGISPDRAFLYSPFGSRCSATSTGISMKTSMNGIESSLPWLAATCRSRAILRSDLYGEIKEVRAMVEESANSLATCSQHH